MPNQNLYFNILTFDYPEEEQVFYFSEHRVGKSLRIYKTQFPNTIDDILPGITEDNVDFIYTTFKEEREGFIPLPLDFRTENKDLIHKFYNQQINQFFKDKGFLVRKTFIGDNQVWVPAQELDTEVFNYYYKYTLRLQFDHVSEGPELILSYDGKSKIFKENVIQLAGRVPKDKYVWFRVENELLSIEHIRRRNNKPEYADCFPVLNNPIQYHLNIAQDPRPAADKYNVYRDQIKLFYTDFLDKDDFKEIIPLHGAGFLKVPKALVDYVDQESNDLLFPNGRKGRTPKLEFKKNKFQPFDEMVRIFFIYHKDDEETKDKLKEYLDTGLGHYKGLTDYTGILYDTDDSMNICYSDWENPLTEVEDFLIDNYASENGVKHLAIYLIPFSKEETRKQKVRIYARIKQLLIKRRIACQFVKPGTVVQKDEQFKWSLTNMSVTIMAKLGGIPWRLDKPEKKSLIVGVGAFKHPDGVRYVSSAFCFDNSGKFREFDYLLSNQTKELAGLIGSKVKEFSNNFGNPEKLVIHFYKQIGEDDIKPIEKELINLKFPNPIPIFIVTINKTFSEDIVAFDRSQGNDFLLPFSGTYISIGHKKYLLYTSTRYPGANFLPKEGVPFPVKLTIDCTDPKQLEQPEIIKELIDEVYQFSRMYWKSLVQQGLPVTVSYPAMVAEVAPHFEGGVIPPEGKDNLWFL